MKGVTSKGYILNSSNYGDSDRIVTMICESLGKVRGIAKGARKSLKRFGGCLEPFTMIKVTIIPKKGLSSILEGKVVKDYKKIKGDLELFAYGSYMLELVDVSTKEGEESRLSVSYSLLTAGLEELNCYGNHEEATRVFEIRLLKSMGYLPSFLTCVSCGSGIVHKKTDSIYREKMELEGVPFSMAKGGVLCGHCLGRNDAKLDSISLGTLKTLDAAAVRRISFSRKALEESKKIIPPFIASQLGRNLKSLDFIKNMEKL